MSDSTRRGFVKNSAAAAAGMTVVGALVAEQADAKAAAKSGPVVAYIRDPRTGEISVMSGEREVKLHDRKIAARIARAAN
ncbi:MAG TPA: twin-arginine translocation signal domain-containing protein [Solirubrobacteraceae bacterium]|nr:twin-arginine translocation signal domain-containing protein [Solirubrobacteraceae bacterium]